MIVCLVESEEIFFVFLTSTKALCAFGRKVAIKSKRFTLPKLIWFKNKALKKERGVT